MNYLRMLFAIAVFSFFGFTSQGNIQLNIENITKAKGKMMVAVYKGEANFLKDGTEVAKQAILVENLGPVQLTFPNLPYGEYSIAVYHDWNENSKLDTNIFGIPNEPYGFSNNARSKWGPPKYEIARFELNETEKKMVIQVKKWSKQ